MKKKMLKILMIFETELTDHDVETTNDQEVFAGGREMIRTIVFGWDIFVDNSILIFI